MKRLFVACIVILISSLVFVIALKQDPGYVLISYGLYTIESSVTVAIITLLLICGGLTVTFLFSFRLLRKSLAFNRWFTTRSHRRSREKTAQGIIAFVEGNWASSRRVLSAAADKSETPLINYLFAAWASNELHDDVKTRELLGKASDSTSGAGIAVEIAQAEMQIDRGYLERSLATLTRAKRNASKYPHVYTLLQQVYIGLNDWDGLAALLPELRKHKILNKDELDALAQQCCVQQLQAIGSHGEKNSGDKARVSLLGVWQQQSKTVTRNSEAVLCYARSMMSVGDEVTAEKVLRDQLNREWNAPLIDLYGLVLGGDVNKQLLHAENWLKERNNDARLFLCLGRLSLRNNLWGKAREYFETSNQLLASSEACGELGRLLANLNKHELSNDYFQKGLLMMAPSLPELPMPGSGS